MNQFTEDDLETDFKVFLSNEIGNQTFTVKIYYGEKTFSSFTMDISFSPFTEYFPWVLIVLMFLLAIAIVTTVLVCILFKKFLRGKLNNS